MENKIYFHEDADKKGFRSETYNYDFDKNTGFFARWGRTPDDDPQFSPIGNEILDWEIVSGKCPGVLSKDGKTMTSCRFCYKDNSFNKEAKILTFDKFKEIFDKITKSRNISQIAFGISGTKTNPDFIKIMKYTRDHGVIPNYTLNGSDLDDEILNATLDLCGAVAVSVLPVNKDLGYDTVYKFTSKGFKQANLHVVISQETFPFVKEVLCDRLIDPRLEKVNAIVFLGIKPKGRAVGHFKPLGLEGYRELINFCLENKIGFGFDSCGSQKFEAVVETMDISDEEKKKYKSVAESCESGLFSIYCNVENEFFPCSFAEGEKGWEKGLKIKDDFLKDVWYHPRMIEWRTNLMSDYSCNGCRKCSIFPEINL